MDFPSGNKHFTWCTNYECPCKMACGRLKRSGSGSDEGVAADALEERFEGGEDCQWFIVRDLLTKEKDIFRGAGHRRHNLHAPGGKTRKRPTPEELGIPRPNLKVKRHIRMGFDINRSAEPRPHDKDDEEDK